MKQKCSKLGERKTLTGESSMKMNLRICHLIKCTAGYKTRITKYIHIKDSYTSDFSDSSPEFDHFYVLV